MTTEIVDIKTSSDELVKLREDALKELIEKYTAVIEFIRKLPIHRMKDLGSENFDQGFMWIREMILTQLQLPTEQDNNIEINTTE
jgi:hypothetical protein